MTGSLFAWSVVSLKPRPHARPDVVVVGSVLVCLGGAGLLLAVLGLDGLAAPVTVVAAGTVAGIGMGMAYPVLSATVFDVLDVPPPAQAGVVPLLLGEPGKHLGEGRPLRDGDRPDLLVGDSLAHVTPSPLGRHCADAPRGARSGRMEGPPSPVRRGAAVPQATVRWFDPERGFGFLDLGDDAEDLFVHASEVLGGPESRQLREGQVVEYELGQGDRGPVATRVRVTGEHGPASALGVLGSVSWYEPTKGYGFVAPDGGGPEVFVHSSAIVGGAVLGEGQRVAFLLVEGPKGPQADHLLALRPERPADGADGTVSWFDAEKGFGFIAPDAGGDDVFVHVRSLARGLSELAEGDRVAYDVVPGDRGPQAREVRVVGGSRRGGGRARGGRPGGSGTGVVVRYDADRGFGFISPEDGGPDLFVHASSLKHGDHLVEGDEVRYTVRQGDKGPQAEQVERTRRTLDPRGSRGSR